MSRLPATPYFRWGLIGPGRIAGQFAAALAAVDSSCLQGVVGRNKHKTHGFARKYGARSCHAALPGLLEDPEIDAVYIATPHRYHFELARDCLLAGKAVLCEKPLTVNASEAQQLIELSGRTGVFLMEALWTRFLPIYDQVRQWLVAGQIGSVSSINSSFGFVAPRKPHDRLLDHAMAGGALLDLGIYNLSMSQWVFGVEPTSHAIAGYLGETRVDEHNEVTLSYGDGRSSKFVCSLTRQLANDFTIHGTSGSIRIHEMFWGATQASLLTGLRSGSRALTICRPFRATGLEYEIEAAQRCIRTGMIECPDIPHNSTLSTMRLMDTLRHDLGLVYDFE